MKIRILVRQIKSFEVTVVAPDFKSARDYAIAGANSSDREFKQPEAETEILRIIEN